MVDSDNLFLNFRDVYLNEDDIDSSLKENFHERLICLLQLFKAQYFKHLAIANFNSNLRIIHFDQGIKFRLLFYQLICDIKKNRIFFIKEDINRDIKFDCFGTLGIPFHLF